MANGRTRARPAGDAVVLVHGLWMTGMEMRFLGRRLSEAGFSPVYFRYRSWRGRLDEAARSLRRRVDETPGDRIHLVGHSLGGVVIAKMLREGDLARPGRVAMLGSPMRGSAVARKLAGTRAGRWLMGEVAREGILEEPPGWRGDRPLLTVAGDLPVGTGLLFRVRRPHDGLIRVEETRVDCAESVVVRTSHIGLLLSGSVAGILASHFRRRGARGPEGLSAA